MYYPFTSFSQLVGNHIEVLSDPVDVFSHAVEEGLVFCLFREDHRLELVD